MMIKASQQAIGLNDDGAIAATLPNAARTAAKASAARTAAKASAAHTAAKASAAHIAAKTDTVAVAQAAQDRARVSMDYQQGFFSGPSS